MTANAKQLAQQAKLIRAIDRNRAEREELEKKLYLLRNKVDGLIVQADHAGVPKLTLANHSGLARQTIYAILLRARAAA